MNTNQIQHGDVLLEKVAKLPGGCRRVKPRNGRLIIAEGEATGHTHTITADKAALYELRGELYVEVAEPVTIDHQEHKSLPIPEGIYTIGRVKEHDYLQDMERQVID